nr:hypothetical transcript [Hymenolepis microstoma]
MVELPPKKIVKPLVIKCPIQDDLDILAEVYDCIHKSLIRPGINAVKTSAHVASTEPLEKLEQIVPPISSFRD